jgi:hypothetical protein
MNRAILTPEQVQALYTDTTGDRQALARDILRMSDGKVSFYARFVLMREPTTVAAWLNGAKIPRVVRAYLARRIGELIMNGAESDG